MISLTSRRNDRENRRWRPFRGVVHTPGTPLLHHLAPNRSEARILFALFCERELSDFVSTAFRFTWLDLERDELCKSFIYGAGEWNRTTDARIFSPSEGVSN